MSDLLIPGVIGPPPVKGRVIGPKGEDRDSIELVVLDEVPTDDPDPSLWGREGLVDGKPLVLLRRVYPERPKGNHWD